jgi:hypothetical protein
VSASSEKCSDKWAAIVKATICPKIAKATKIIKLFMFAAAFLSVLGAKRIVDAASFSLKPSWAR